MKSRALLALLLLVPAPSLGVLASFWLLPGPPGKVIYGFCKLWLVAFPALWHLTVDRERPGWSPPRRGGLGTGAVLGAGLGAIIVAAHFGVGREWIDVEFFRRRLTELGLGTPGRYLALAVYIFTLNALMEEYVWRWFVVRKLEALLPGTAAILVSAGFFTAHHVLALAAYMPWKVTVLGSAGVFAGGAIWSWCYLRYRSIWPGYMSHLIVDIVILAIGWTLLFP